MESKWLLTDDSAIGWWDSAQNNHSSFAKTRVHVLGMIDLSGLFLFHFDLDSLNQGIII